ncbi:MAG: Holliday junction resolvase RuvX [Planctomycetota bacterium]
MRVMGIDYGTKRVGYALSDPEGKLAFPGGVVEERDEAAALARIAELARAEGAGRIVVGLPITLSGEEGIAAKRAQAFADGLRRRAGVPVETFDERLSTVRAERTLLSRDLSRAKRARKIDAVAATLFLQTYLDRQGRLAEKEDPADAGRE